MLSYTGGAALDELRRRLGARRVAAALRPRRPGRAPAGRRRAPHYRADLSYLGTYAETGRRRWSALFVEPARAAPEQRFLIGGAQYPQDFPWTDNIYFVRHLPPADAPGLLLPPRALTLNVTRAGDGRDGLVPVRAAVRGRRLRRAAPDRLRGTGSTPSSRPARRSWSRATRTTAVAALRSAPSELRRDRATRARARAGRAHRRPARRTTLERAFAGSAAPPAAPRRVPASA